MKTRTLEHKREVKVWITFILSILLWIGSMWWIDSLELAIFDSWAEWMDSLHFLISLLIIIVYFTIIMVIIHFYWKLIAWIIGKLIDKYY